jgi:hypothetical protein
MTKSLQDTTRPDDLAAGRARWELIRNGKTGMRLEPPPSWACASGTMPAATAAADPPEEPPVE